jgi:peptidoglycan/xylan/chitin deacetylase (PgdA/CDA1 family)
MLLFLPCIANGQTIIRGSADFQGNPATATKIAIIKADDVKSPTEQWKRFIVIAKEKNVKVSCGIICDSLVDAKKEYTDWLIAEEKSGFVEFWNHGWDHTRWEKDGKKFSEFSRTGHAYQIEHFNKAQKIMQEVFGVTPLAFGTPYNGFDNDTARMLEGNKQIKLLFCKKDPQISGIVAAEMLFPGEPDGTGKPNAAKFAMQYESTKDGINFAAIQFHPNSFQADHFEEYAKTLDILLKDGWTFMLPREYVAQIDK